MNKIFLISIALLFSPIKIQSEEIDRSDYTQIECEIIDLPDEINSIHNDNMQTRGSANSTNWAGYEAALNFTTPATNSVDAVYGSWIVPTVLNNTFDTASVAWIGIDGARASRTVQQIGTGQYWRNNKVWYFAWYCMWPLYGLKQLSGFPVEPGDSITTSVEYSGNNVYTMKIYNDTKKVSTTAPTSQTTSADPIRSCAEWIIEPPGKSGTIQDLTNFGTIQFSNCTCTINGVKGPINSSSWKNDSVTMVRSGSTKAVPSALYCNGQSFNITWKDY